MIRRGFVCLFCLLFAMEASAAKKQRRKRTIGDLKQYFELETTVQTTQFFTANPSDTSLYPHKTDSGNQLFLREVAQIYLPNGRIEANVYHLLAGNTGKSSILGLLTAETDSQYRSDFFSRTYSKSEATEASYTFDSLALFFNLSIFRFSLGRFAIDLSKTRIFRPNDFFAPFRAENFSRRYRPGVDAASLEFGIGLLSTVQLIGVRGYTGPSTLEKISGDSTRNRLNYEQSTMLASGSFNLGGVALGVIAGIKQRYQLIGGSLQGEIGDILGYRFEGNYRTNKEKQLTASDFAGGVEKRFGENFLLSFEGLFHGRGYTNPASYETIAEDAGAPEGQLGRFYLGLGTDWQFEPLTALKVLTQGNMSDSSLLITARIVHSLSQNSEIAISATIPSGKTPKEGVLKSEYGTFPRVIQAEATLTF